MREDESVDVEIYKWDPSHHHCFANGGAVSGVSLCVFRNQRSCPDTKPQLHCLWKVLMDEILLWYKKRLSVCVCGWEKSRYIVGTCACMWVCVCVCRVWHAGMRLCVHAREFAQLSDNRAAAQTRIVCAAFGAERRRHTEPIVRFRWRQREEKDFPLRQIFTSSFRTWLFECKQIAFLRCWGRVDIDDGPSPIFDENYKNNNKTVNHENCGGVITPGSNFRGYMLNVFFLSENISQRIWVEPQMELGGLVRRGG